MAKRIGRPLKRKVQALKPLLPWRTTHIRDWREERGLTLEKMVELLAALDPPIEIKYQSLSRLERGLQKPPITLIEGIAKILNIDIDSMLNRSPSRHREWILEIIRDAIKPSSKS